MIAQQTIDTTLIAVENELTEIPNDPAAWNSDGRMYPVQDDNIRSVPDRPDLHRLARLGHDAYLRDNGAIEIQQRQPRKVLLSKTGADGRGVWDE